MRLVNAHQIRDIQCQIWTLRSPWIQLWRFARKMTGNVKLKPACATREGGLGTGSERWIMASAASSNEASPEPFTMLADVTRPVSSRTQFTRISAACGDIFSNHRGKFLQLHLTIDDEGVFTTPWTATLTYVPGPGVLSEVVCAENIHQYYYDHSDANVPRTDKPDF
jgi:hypothetical protein